MTRDNAVLLRIADVPTLDVERIDLWWSDDWYRESPANADVGEAHVLLTAAAARNPELVGVHDALSFAQADCDRLYTDEVMATAVAWNLRLGNLFGSRRYPGSSAGRYVPALVVRFTGDSYPLAAPHEEWRRTNGVTSYELHTAMDTLRMLKSAEQERIFGQLV